MILAGQSATMAQDAAAGRAIFKSRCTSCHALDRRVSGPALAGVQDRHEEAWLLKWIKGASSMIDAGDPAAVKLFEEYKPTKMPNFPDLTEGDIKNMLAYISEGEKAPAGAPAAGAAAPQKEEISGLQIAGVAVVIVIALLVIVLLNRVIKSLENVILKNKGEVVPEPVAVKRGEGFKKLLKNKKFLFFTIILLLIVGGTYSWMAMWNTGVHTGYQPEQPIKFSHQLHAGINKIDCRYCHSGAYSSKNASIPSLNVCMNCHNYVTASDKYNGQVSPEIQKIYTAMDYNPTTRAYGPNTKPVEWVRIHNLPDLAYFNHSQHVSVAGVRCQQCHGPVQTMEEMYQYSPLTMKWCIQCHKRTEVNSEGNAYYDKMIAAHDKIKKGEKVTAAVLGGTECGKCHY
jgi:mono/diheme cytochrome c family protein